MLYFLNEILNINLLSYISVRAGIAFFLALCATIFLMPYYIKWASAKGAEQPISDYAPKAHKQKAKTPTMGGLLFILITIISCLICVRLDNLFALGALGVLAVFCAIGVIDDWRKVSQSKNAGISARAKFTLQILSGLGFSMWLYFAGLESSFYLPFYKNEIWSWGLLSLGFWTLVFVATSNAVNLTDGLDGLVAIPSIYSLVSLGAFVYVAGHSGLSSYLLWPRVDGVGEVAIISAALIGSLIGFLWYNCHPAQVFMGDSGSLAIGGFIAYMAILSKNELLLFLIGFVFVIEALSVILQIGSYKTRGKRIFLMAPLHHHFEEKGLAESKIIVRFWIVALMSNLIALLSLKLH